MTQQKNRTPGDYLRRAAVPLIFWPFIVLPNLMALGAMADANDMSTLEVVLANIVLCGSLAYPIPLAITAIAARILLGKDQYQLALRISKVPRFYLVILLAALLLGISIASL